MADASQLQQNELTVICDACALLTRILTNVVENPTEVKYRRISIANPGFQRKVWNVVGGRQFLFSVGWTERDGFVQFEPQMPLTLLKDGLSALWIEEQRARQLLEEQWLQAMEEKVRSERLDQPGPLEAEVHKFTAQDFPLEAQAFFHASDEVLLPAVRLLRELLGRIVRQPAVLKYRRLNTGSFRFATAVGNVPGSGALLSALGFALETPDAAASSSSSSSSSSSAAKDDGCELDEGSGGRLVLPETADLTPLRSTLSLLADLEADLTARQFEQQRAAAALLRAKQQALPKPPPKRSTQEGRAAWQEENERSLTASQLISEIAAMMHLVWVLEGEVGYYAHYRMEQKRLLEQFKMKNDFEGLHRLKEEWECRLEELKRKTGKSLVSTIPQSCYAVEEKPSTDPQAVG
eukprot:GGOE01043746.1.p1 GENE.GGOE01043746.1~~GGOE01043746.1.p1  ORF type:complete len:430 (-),score=148.47 GGOE01043746.1:281-1504(-)